MLRQGWNVKCAVVLPSNITCFFFFSELSKPEKSISHAKLQDPIEISE